MLVAEVVRHGVAAMRIGLFMGLLLLAGLTLTVPAPEPEAEFAPKPHPRGYVALRAPKPPVIDGKPDEEAWKAAPWSDDFGDIEGEAKPKPRYRTRMKMLWDEKYLYIAAELDEPDVWATITEHDAVIFHDPDFEVFLDPDGNNQLYAELELNAKNTTWDLLLTKPYKDSGQAINGWEIAGMKTAVAIDGTLNNPMDVDRGWSVEIAIPHAAVKELTNATFPPKDGDRWRINFSRVQWDTEVKAGKTVKIENRPEHNWVWSPQGVVDMHRPERWGYLQFSSATSNPPAFAPDPDAALKDWLHEFYYAQRMYHKEHRHYAKSSADLTGGPAGKTTWGAATLETTTRGFTATAGAKGRRWTISQDSHLQKE